MMLYAALKTIQLTNTVTVHPGETFSDEAVFPEMEPRRRARLMLSLTTHRKVTLAPEAPIEATKTTETPGLKHIGGPWYEVHGKRYKGKKAAEEALAG